MMYPDIRDFHKLQGKKVDIKLSWEQLNDIMYYLEWKLIDISESGNDLEIDASGNVTIGNGAASVVSVPGVLNVANDIILDDGGSIKEASGTAAITINSDGEITVLMNTLMNFEN